MSLDTADKWILAGIAIGLGYVGWQAYKVNQSVDAVKGVVAQAGGVVQTVGNAVGAVGGLANRMVSMFSSDGTPTVNVPQGTTTVVQRLDDPNNFQLR